MNRRDGYRDVNFVAVLAPANGLESRDPRAPADRRDDPVFLSLSVLRDYRADVAADDLFGGVAKDPLGRGVPRQNRAIEPLSDNRIVSGLYDGRKQCRGIGTEVENVQRPALPKA